MRQFTWQEIVINCCTLTAKDFGAHRERRPIILFLFFLWLFLYKIITEISFCLIKIFNLFDWDYSPLLKKTPNK